MLATASITKHWRLGYWRENLQPTISLRAYALRINVKGRPREVVFRNDTAFTVLKECLTELATPRGAARGAAPIDRLFTLDRGSYSATTGPDRRISGRMRAGTSGYSSEIIAPEGTLAFARQPAHTEVIPYHFLASIPEADRTPIVIIQQSSGNGLYLFFASIFLDKLKNKLSREDLTINLNPIHLSGLYIRQFYENGVVKGISAVAHKLSSDAADDAREARIHSEISLSPVRQKDAIATVKELLSGPDGKPQNDKRYVFSKVKQLFELENMDDVQELTIEAEMAGVRRRISIGDNFGTTFDISHEIKRDKHGHPDRTEMDAYVEEFVSKSIRPYYGS